MVMSGSGLTRTVALPADNATGRRRTLRVGAALIVLVLVALWPCRRLLSGAEVLDLRVYLTGGQAVLHGHNLYSPGVRVRQYGFTYPPFAGLLFALPSLLPQGWAISYMTLLSFAALAVMIRLADVDLVRRLTHRPTLRTIVVVGAMIACQPVRTTLWNGQVDLILAALVMLDLIARRGRPGEGMLVGLAAAIKLTPAIFVLYLLIRRRFRAAATAAATFLFVSGGAWLLLPGDSTRYWTQSLFDGTGIGDISRASNQSILGVTERLTNSTLAKPLYASLVIPVLILGLGIAARLSNVGRESFALAAVGMTGCLISPVAWSHHWVWFVPWIAGLAGSPARNAATRIGAAAFISYIVAINSVSQPMIQRFTPIRVTIQNSYSLAIVIACMTVAVARAIDSSTNKQDRQVGRPTTEDHEHRGRSRHRVRRGGRPRIDGRCRPGDPAAPHAPSAVRPRAEPAPDPPDRAG